MFCPKIMLNFFFFLVHDLSIFFLMILCRVVFDDPSIRSVIHDSLITI